MPFSNIDFRAVTELLADGAVTPVDASPPSLGGIDYATLIVLLFCIVGKVEGTVSVLLMLASFLIGAVAFL